MNYSGGREIASDLAIDCTGSIQEVGKRGQMACPIPQNKAAVRHRARVDICAKEDALW